MIVLGYDPAVEVAANKVAQHLGNIDNQQIDAIQLWNSQEIEGIGNRVGKATQDEDRYTKQERQEFAFSSELDGSSHDETTTNSEQETGQRTFSQSRLHNGKVRRQNVWLGIGTGKGSQCTAYNVTKKDGAKHRPVAFGTDEACSSCIEFELVMDDGKKTESE